MKQTPGNYSLVQSLYWSLAIIGIVSIGAVLTAQLSGGIRRNIIVTLFLVTAWWTDVVILLPAFGRVWDYTWKTKFDRTNVYQGAARYICHTNAIGLAFFFPAVSAFALSFAAEVLRILLRVWWQTRALKELEQQDPSIGSPTARKTEKGDFTPTYTNRPTTPSLRSSLKGRRSFVSWCLILLPFIIGLTCVAIDIYYDAMGDFKWINSSPLMCSIPWIAYNTQVSAIKVAVAGLAALAGLAASGLYLRLTRSTHAVTGSKLDRRLLIRLGVLTFVSTSISAIYGLIHLSPGKLSEGKSLYQRLPWLPPLVMSILPVIGPLLSVERDVIAEWKKWARWILRRPKVLESSTSSTLGKENESV